MSPFVTVADEVRRPALSQSLDFCQSLVRPRLEIRDFLEQLAERFLIVFYGFSLAEQQLPRLGRRGEDSEESRRDGP